MTPALRADRLGKRYGHAWALREATFEVPSGAVVGLVGPNGAGKSTLLQMTIGLLEPTEGQVTVFGATSRANRADTLGRVSYVAQDHPLYREFNVSDMFRFGRCMNPTWDQALAERRMATLGIPLRRKIKRLSGGQQAQVALAMALAKRAPLLVLDEPVASLDPVARLEFMREVMAAVADTGLTVVIASHVVSELERICDHVIVLTGPRQGARAEVSGVVVQRTDSDRHSVAVVRTHPGRPDPAGWQAKPVGFEELVLAYLQHPASADLVPGQADPRPGSVAKAVSR